MLKNVCDRCGKVIDGDGNLPDFNAFDAYIDDEPVISYIHLCDKCRQKISDILIYNIDGKKRPQKKKEAPKKDAPALPKNEDTKVQPELEDNNKIPNQRDETADVLPSLKNESMGRVTNRVPISKIRHFDVTTPLFDD